MNERSPRTDSSVLQAEKSPSADVLMARILSAKRQIAAIRAGIDLPQTTPLPHREYNQLKNLYEKASRDLIALLKLRQQTDLEARISVSVEMFPGEEVHPFSTNGVVIEAPSTESDKPPHKIHTSLSELRGEDVSDSLEALALIGKSTVTESAYVGPYLKRTDRELRRINYEINMANKGKSKFTVGELGKLTRKIVRQQQIPAIPQMRL